MLIWLYDYARENSPVVKQAKVLSAYRKTAQFRVQFDRTSHVYYTYSYKGTTKPEVSQIIDQVPVAADVDQYFGKTVTDDNSHVAIIDLTGLQAKKDYVMYIVGSDQSNNLTESVTELEFRTPRRHRPSSFSIRTTLLVNSDLVRSAVIATLAVPQGAVIFTGTDPSIYDQGNGRRLADAIPTYLYDLTLLYVEEDEDATPPIDLVHLLDKRLDILQSNLPSLDTSYSISNTASEIQATNPDFITGPDVFSLSHDNIRISAAMNTGGTICGIILESGQPDPISDQIVRGQNAANQNLPEGHFDCVPAQYETPSLMEFTQLDDDQEYVVWISGKNELPGEAEVMEDAYIRSYDFTTLVYVSGERAILMHGQMIASSIILLLFTILA